MRVIGAQLEVGGASGVLCPGLPSVHRGGGVTKLAAAAAAALSGHLNSYFPGGTGRVLRKCLVVTNCDDTSRQLCGGQRPHGRRDSRMTREERCRLLLIREESEPY